MVETELAVRSPDHREDCPGWSDYAPYGDTRLWLVPGDEFYYIACSDHPAIGYVDHPPLAMTMASATAFGTIGNYFILGFYSINFWDLLFWQACFFLIIKVLQTQNVRYWLIFGLVAGLALMNKISVLFLLFGLGVGLRQLTEESHKRNPSWHFAIN